MYTLIRILIISILLLVFGCGGSDETKLPGKNNQGSPDLACKKIDLLFAVDDSGSMQEAKNALRNDVFPAFSESLKNVAKGLDDYRVGVMDACAKYPSMHTRGDGGSCNFSSGEVWMDSRSTDLKGEFSCVGDIYSGDFGDGDNSCTANNDDEQPASTAVTALEAPFRNTLNDNFLRKDALLVVVAITDEDEQSTIASNTTEIYDRLVAIKGDVHRMVFLGIGGQDDCHGLYGNAEEAVKLKEVTAKFTAKGQGLFWDICGGPLEQGFDEALALIDSSCEALPDLPPIGEF